MSALFHLIYTSKSCDELGSTTLLNIAKQARFNNLIHQVTGLLLYGEQQFIQVLEGKEKNVIAIFEGILQDKRHHSIQVVVQEPIQERAFHNWNMGLTIFSQYPDLKEALSKQLNIAYTNFAHFDAISLIKSFSHHHFQQYIN